jgi:Tetratricopeptide repeat
VVFVVDALGGWLVGLLADAGRKKLTMLVLGTDQQRALHQAAAAAVDRTAEQLAPSGGGPAGQLAMVVGEVFRDPAPELALAGQATLLEALHAGIADKLAVLDDPDITGTGQSSAELLGVPGGVLAETLAGHLVGEIMVRGFRGGPLAPLADQLNHDVTHLQGRRLEGMFAQLADQVMALAQASGPETLGKPVRLPPPPAFLAGREELLAEMSTRLTAGDDRVPRLVALWGLGGAGKTSVALRYAHQNLAEVEVAWLFRAEDATVLAAGFGELATQLGVRGLADVGDLVASVHAVLATFASPWLLIFDNVADPASVAAFLPPAGPGRVLITSQNPNWPGHALRVPELGREVAADFLVNRTGDLDRQAARDLAGELGGLPLVLEQAAAYIWATGGTLAGYLALFRQRRSEMLARGEPTGYDKTVASTWALAFDRLQAAPGAVGLLRLVAFFAPESIPLRMLLRPRAGLTGRLSQQVASVLAPLLEDPLAAGDAIGALHRYSLVTPAADGSVSVHRLVQAVTADQMPAELARDWRQAAAALIEDAIPGDTALPGAWQVCAALLPHAQAALAEDSDGLARIASYLGSSGSYAAARDLQRRVVDARQRVLGPEHPDTLAAAHDLAHWTGQAGDPAAARDLLANLLLALERILGPEHPNALTVKGNLASWTGQAGDLAAARDLVADLLPVLERVLGPEHPNTLAARHELARWTGLAGNPTSARDLLAKLLPVLERVLGPEHPYTLAARYQHATVTGQAGEPAAARDLVAGLLPVRERILGPEHPDTLMTRGQLARWTGQARDAAAARDQYAELLPVYKRALGPDYPDTLTAQGNLASSTGQAGNPAAARDQYAELLPVRDRVLGPEHPDTLAARAELARWTGHAGDPAAARNLLSKLLPTLEHVLGPEHPDTQMTRRHLARWTEKADDGH